MARGQRTDQTKKRRSTGGTKKARPRHASASILDPEARRDIYGIILVAAAIALAIALLSGGAGMLGAPIASTLRLTFGLGAYVLPVLLLLWGVTFFVRAIAISTLRVAAGLGIVLLALIGMLALGSPEPTQWRLAELQAHGGYVGAALAWALRSLVGVLISTVLLAALMLIGLVLTGLSVSGFVEWTTGRFQKASARREDPHAARVEKEKRPKTLPMQELDETHPVAAKTRPIKEGRPGSDSVDDPEMRRKTQPALRTSPPKAMEGFELPPMAVLERSAESASRHRTTDREIDQTARTIEETLGTFDIPAKVVGWTPGPTVTMYEIELPRGIKVNRVTALADDLSLALAATTVRILAPIPGKSVVGVEVPNERRSTVTLGDVLAGSVASGGPILLGIGKDVSGDPVLADLSVMPHLLIAGSTGTGKSVCINSILTSVLMRATPAEVRLILIDPKRIELSLYNEVPHLYVPVVTEPKEAASALAWAVSEMDSRLRRLQRAGARNIGVYNAMVQDGKGPDNAEEMPYLMIVIDELADLMMVAAKEVEDSICRLAQLARAAGIHLVVATQRPSTDIITGLIKTNITNRIAFAVSSSIDSRVILDQPGAERLVGLGDMLFSTPAWPKPKRIQGAFVSEDEIVAVAEHLKNQAEPDYHEEILHHRVAPTGGGTDSGKEDDPLLWEAADIVVGSGLGSTSMLQRRLKVGYARAGRIMDMLEAKGVVGPPDGSKPRAVLLDVEDLEALKAMERSEEQAGGADDR